MKRTKKVFTTIVLGGLIFLLGHITTIYATAPHIELINHANEFSQSYNSWARRCNTLSFSSLDYWEKLGELWHKKEIGEKFRILEGAVNEDN